MQFEIECEVKIRCGSLPWEVSERLAQLSGNWLEFSPEEGAIVVRHVQPVGCPAMSGVPCELISILDSIPSDHREKMPGGTLYVRDKNGQVLRLLVKGGELLIQWPHLDYAHSKPESAGTLLDSINPREARVCGWARFAGSPERAKELAAFVDRFEGLYPEGDMPSECEQNLVSVRFRDVNVGPRELVYKLETLADARESLEAELDVSSFAPGALDRSFRIRIERGRIHALRPSLWR
jgi:hypothetical protein